MGLEAPAPNPHPTCCPGLYHRPRPDQSRAGDHPIPNPSPNPNPNPNPHLTTLTLTLTLTLTQSLTLSLSLIGIGLKSNILWLQTVRRDYARHREVRFPELAALRRVR